MQEKLMARVATDSNFRERQAIRWMYRGRNEISTSSIPPEPSSIEDEGPGRGSVTNGGYTIWGECRGNELRLKAARDNDFQVQGILRPW
jgi:hypothetical protein